MSIPRQASPATCPACQRGPTDHRTSCIIGYTLQRLANAADMGLAVQVPPPAAAALVAYLRGLGLAPEPPT